MRVGRRLGQSHTPFCSVLFKPRLLMPPTSSMEHPSNTRTLSQQHTLLCTIRVSPPPVAPLPVTRGESLSRRDWRLAPHRKKNTPFAHSQADVGNRAMVREAATIPASRRLLFNNGANPGTLQHMVQGRGAYPTRCLTRKR